MDKLKIASVICSLISAIASITVVVLTLIGE